jgi:SAM dependent carboxyl methyltransferase
MALASKGEVLAAFERQAARDWKSFLSLRAGELRSRGRLVVVLPGRDDDGRAGFEPLFQHANEALSELVADGAITAQERAGMALGAYPRRRCELLEPFRMVRLAGCGLNIIICTGFRCRLDYERDGNKEVLVNRHAAFFRAIFVPSLASPLREEENQAFANELDKRLKRRLREQRYTRSCRRWSWPSRKCDGSSCAFP